MGEQEIMQVLSQDLSVGTESFRDALLARCLEELGGGERPAGEEQPAELGDEELEWLAAAGDPTASLGERLPGVDDE